MDSRQQKYYDKLLIIVNKKNGRIFGDYTKTNNKMKFECEEGHQWETSPNYIIRGHWCPDCGGSKKLTIEILEKNGNRKRW